MRDNSSMDGSVHVKGFDMTLFRRAEDAMLPLLSSCTTLPREIVYAHDTDIADVGWMLS
eukprot:m.192021 g.192021  ORF g.192021 m.192021 type:complete len:59 (+) comp18605_c0_seq2:1661-1837(+)